MNGNRVSCTPNENNSTIKAAILIERAERDTLLLFPPRETDNFGTIFLAQKADAVVLL